MMSGFANRVWPEGDWTAMLMIAAGTGGFKPIHIWIVHGRICRPFRAPAATPGDSGDSNGYPVNSARQHPLEDVIG